MASFSFVDITSPVTSYTEVWIEIYSESLDDVINEVSPPIRRCGLKSQPDECIAKINKSPPIRRCGLKLVISTTICIGLWSPPIRRCGLKYLYGLACLLRFLITSHTEVWIEIRPNCTFFHADKW